MGTPDIAASMLARIAPQQKVCGVFCQPDKPLGRKAVVTPPPVKVAAQALGIPVYQPLKLKDGAAADTVRALAPDIIVVVAYGRILPREILEIPPEGCVNIHVSLLPKYRGAAPIQHALLNGETETGVTAMYMAEGMDTGDIIAQVRLPITEEDDAATLFARAADAGGALLEQVLDDIAAGTARRQPQNEALASYAPPLSKDMGRFTFEEDARRIFGKVRGLCLWPNAYFERAGRTVKVLKARLSDAAGQPGQVLSLQPLTVATQDGALQLLEVKPEGGRLMTGREYAMGLRLKEGQFLIETHTEKGNIEA